jgi:lysophospholipase L1-like esterase
MKISFAVLLGIMLVQSNVTVAQTSKEYTWWNPAGNEFPVLQGQAWPQELKGNYYRLPPRAEKTVRPEVWNLSRNSAGLAVSFKTNSPEIVVKYKVSGDISFPHMPATGVSGVDLYAVGKDGQQLWCKGSYSFNDTIVYRFKSFDENDSLNPFHPKGGEYTLYLPLYNTITWLNIGVVTNYTFTPSPLRKEKPIVVYGTSIAQGGCASRPGMAWPAIVGRKFDRPVINLGFSGNGRLEKELVELCGEIDAKIFVMDCFPNLTGTQFPLQEIKSRIVNSVNILRKAHPLTPILFVEHTGFGDAAVNAGTRNSVNDINKLLEETIPELKAKGATNIFVLTKDELGLSFDGMVDGIHPTDLGMQQYADGFEKKVRGILHEPVGDVSTKRPRTQNRDANTYDWKTRHEQVLTLNAENPPSILFIGNSITHYWGGEPLAPVVRGEDSWKKFIEAHNVRNLGFGWDRVENVLWRVYHDELDGYAAKQVVFMIGTNNLQFNSDGEIVEGLKFLLSATRARQPNSSILLLGIYPRVNHEKRIAQINERIAALAKLIHVRYADPGKSLLGRDGKINPDFFTNDGVHPNARGYNEVGQRLGPLLEK